MHTKELISNLKAVAASLVLKLSKTGRLLYKLLTASLANVSVIPEKSLCVSIGIDGISVCYGSKFLSRVRVICFRNILPENDRHPDPDDFASIVFSALKELKVNKTDIILSIPKIWTIIQPVEFPLAVKKELSSAVSFELDRLTPLSPENALYDFTTQSEKDGKICLTLVAARADLVNRYMEALAGKGMRVKRVTINLSGISTLLTYMDKKSDFIFVQINKFAYEGGLITNGSILSGFTGRFNNDETSGWEKLTKEINTLIAAHSGHGKPLKLIADFITGAEIIPEHKFSMPVQNLRHMDMKLLPARNNRQDMKKLPCIAAGGMLELLQSKTIKPDLLSKGVHKESKAPVGLTVFLLLILLAIGAFHIIMPFRMEKQMLAEIDRQIVSVKNEAKKVEKLKMETQLIESDIASIDNFKHNSPMLLPILKELTIILPAKAWLTRIKIGETTVDIEGYADTATDILPKLESSPYFKKAEFASATTRDSKKNVDRFAIKMEIRGIKKDVKEAVKSETKK
ncbi:PilN domain-containing protein [Desulfobacterium sp. N47]|uniref:PilN domain-containing protein n=1 Tax=Desulfobacterium sp. N47 TaxID=3115210 RepID=UPI003C9C61D0